ncbi:MAG: von Willebrand factor type A domain-containing protein [Akkermansiaceae bacterium]
MNDILQPLGDEHLEARITAYVLGDASPFEAAEIQSLCDESPELKLFLNRTRALHKILQETQASESDHSWKLSTEKRQKLDGILGASERTEESTIAFQKESSIRKASFRAAVGIAACVAVTFIISRLYVFPKITQESATVVSYSESNHAEPELALNEMAFETERFEPAPQTFRLRSSRAVKEKKQSLPANAVEIPVPEIATVEPDVDFGEGSGYGDGFAGSSEAIPDSQDMRLAEGKERSSISIGGQVKAPGVQEFKQGLTLGDAINAAGGETAFGAKNRVRVYRNGEAKTYNLNDERLAQIELQPNDTIEMPQKNWLGRDMGIQDTIKPLDVKQESTELNKVSEIALKAELTSGSNSNLAKSGLRSGDAVIDRKNIDTLLNQGESQRFDQMAGDIFPPITKPTAELSAPQEPRQRQELATQLKEIEALATKLEKLAPDPKQSEVRSNSEDDQKRLTVDGDAMLSGITKTNELGKPGRYEDSLGLSRQAGGNSPNDSRIEDELKRLDDPIRTNPALSNEPSARVDEVRRNLYLAEGNFDLGKYDDAKKAYQDTLRVDPYNAAARRGMEKIAATKSDYYRAAYDQTRAKLLMEVDKAWELPVPAEKGKNLERDLSDRGDLPADLFADESVHALPEWYDKNGRMDNRPEQIETTTKSVDETKQENWKFDSEKNQPKGNTSGTDSVDPFAETPSGGIEEQGSAKDQPFHLFYSDGLDQDKRRGIDPEVAFPVTPATPTERQLQIGETNHKNGNSRDFIYPTEYEPTKELSDKERLGLRGTTPLLGDIPNIGRLFSKDADDITGNVLKQMAQKKLDLADLSQEIPTSEEPFSTFSLNISDASFQIAFAAVQNGERPDPTSIKPEQFYNGVDYGDPAPSSSEPVAAAIDQTAHPVIPGRNLVRIGVRTASTGRSEAQPLRLTLLVDQSGSMVRNDRRNAMKKALEQLSTLLTEKDEVTVIGFSRTPRLLADSLAGNKTAKLPDLINQTANEGGTNIEQAMKLATEVANRHKLEGAQNRIVLFTDGAANLGNADPDRLAEKVKDLRQQGLAFDIAGIGTNEVNDELLAELARHGNGRYYLVGKNTGESFANQLAGAFRPAAENVKVQVKLNPQRVGTYKLIGFEKDRLKTEDFRDDSVDAAELAADEAGVAIYQVEPLTKGSGEIGEISVRFRDTASGEMVERTWTIPYQPSTPAFDKAAPKTQLATLSLLAAQKLQGGPLADAINLNNFSKTIATLRQTFKADPKAQQMLQLINALK